MGRLADVCERYCALADGELTVAEARLAGYATTEAGQFDAARGTRRGLPEAILADGEAPARRPPSPGRWGRPSN